MAVDVNAALSKAYDDLRSIDMDLSGLSGLQDRFTRKRVAADSTQFSSNDQRRVQDVGRKIVVGHEISAKRGRYADDRGTGGVQRQSDRDYSPPSRSHRTLSSVVLPTTIETKSRAAIISEKKKSENKEDVVRNRRLFNNLLAGTLRQFQKEEKTVGNKGQAQIEKQREVERRLEETEKENRERLLRERDQLMAKRREKEMEIQALRRQKAIEQSAEEKMKHFQRLACFIQTQTKPPLFFLPAKHTLRTLELLKESSKKIEALIELRRGEMDRELKRLESYTHPVKEENDSDQEYDGEKGLKSAIVVKNEPPNRDEEHPPNGHGIEGQGQQPEMLEDAEGSEKSVAKDDENGDGDVNDSTEGETVTV